MTDIKKLCAVCLLALLVAGCARSRPIIKYTKLADVPKFTSSEISSLSAETMEKLIKKDEMLKSYILTLEAKIDKYNEYARQSHR